VTGRGESECTVCAASAVEQFIQLADVPLFCNVQWATKEEALAAERGRIDLAFCRACGHIFNTAFEPDRVVYTERYENSLHFSDRFQEYAQALVEQLISRYQVRGKTVAEIGCGKGEFLSLLCERGGNRGLGFDPGGDTKGVGPATGASQRIEIIPEMPSDWKDQYRGELVCCRQVLEHVQHPRDLLRSVREAMAPGGAAYVEVPNALFSLRYDGFWDLLYEHCSYFTPPSLATAVADAGLVVREIYEGFGGQYLCVEAGVAGHEIGHEWSQHRAEELGSLAVDVRSFRRRYRRRVEEW
jgi:2-polyprenyl-3-methyl-5-hydroxy-6-metoxy-1,4-benzoquinol methylase